MTKLQMHPATHKAALQHRTTPGRSRNRHQSRLRAILGMSRNQSLPATHHHRRITTMLRLYLQNAMRPQSIEKHATLNLRANNVAIHLIAQIDMRSEQCIYLRKPTIKSKNARKK